ncbi:tyrosine-type recombinase/integrase [Bdellovibrio sp. HCB290]|uniref:tyrosine-type recombinase/integrase n=1 Tax=Bdellovibrio sp. HCB290 TaxID=3394356 RepID=UPI0039B48979
MAKIEKEVRKFIKSYVTKKGIRWKAAVPDGRGGQIREQGFLEQSHAISFAKHEFTKTLMQNGKVDQSYGSKISFSEYTEQWLESKIRDGLAPITVLRYKDQVKHFLKPYFGPFRTNELDKHHLRNYISESHSNSMSSYNINSSVTLFKMIMRQAIEDDLSNATGLLTIRTPKHRAKDPQFWDQKQMSFFLNAVTFSKWLQLWKFVLWTGLRAGEVSALKWECILLDVKSGSHTGFIKVCRTCRQKTREIRETTKNGENRMIPIFPELHQMILKMKSQASGEFVFGGDKPLDPSHFSRMLAQDLRKIPQLKKINFHGLRHTFCSYLDSTGMSRRIVAEIMGHRDLSTTDRYSHVSNQVLGSEVTRWSESRNKQNPNNIFSVAQ